MGLDGLGPLVTRCSAERAVPGLVGMPLDQEDALRIAAQPRRVPVEDAHVTWPHLRGSRRKVDGGECIRHLGRHLPSSEACNDRSDEGSSGKIITDARA